MPTDPRENEHYERIPDDPSHVRCIVQNPEGLVCGHILPAPEIHKKRVRTHYAGEGRGAKYCEYISPEQRSNFRDEDLTTARFKAPRAGFRRFEATRARPYATYFAHDADCRYVQCLYCDCIYTYQEDRMLTHLVTGSRDIVICPAFPEEVRPRRPGWTDAEKLRQELGSFRARKTQQVDDALLRCVRAMEAEGKSRREIMDWYHSKPQAELIEALVALPLLTRYKRPPVEELLSQP